MTVQVTSLNQSGFRRAPWKNGGGESITIAEAYRDGAKPGDWGGLVWSLSRTAIVTPAPFSDLAGIERMQVLVEGGGLVLVAPDTEIDVRQAFQPVRFQGDTPIVSRLEAGPVEVVNLMGNRARTRLDLRVLRASVECGLAPGDHILYAANEACDVRCDGTSLSIAPGDALLIESDQACTIEGQAGRTIVASVFSI